MTEPSQQPPPNDEIADRVVHEVDGIQEYDNKLPRWWLATFYGTIAFAVVYWYAYHTTGFATLPGEQYKKDSVKLALEEAKKTGAVSDEMLAAFVADRSNAQKGQEVFTTNCVVCHRADGGGGVGPNLTDAKWIYGSAPKTIFGTIHKGIADKGMPAWGPQLGLDRTLAATAYVLSLKNTNAPGGKAPQGEKD